MVDKITVLYFGMYDPEYSRNRILIDGLKQNGVEVIECRDDSPGLKKFWNLFIKHWHVRNSYDVMVIGFLGHIIVPFAKIITRKPIIFDAFVSLYDSNVFDRKVVKPKTLRAFYYWFLDWLSMHLADVVLFDTEQHINYACGKFNVRKEKFRRILVGAQSDIFHPFDLPKKNEKFLVEFHGTFIPVQGIEFIIRAAKELKNYKDIEFIIIGSGQEKEKTLELARKLEVNNIKFNGFLPKEKLVEKISEANICLGIFGKTQKTQRVIPNKLYQCAAMKKPIITADTPAIRELFNDRDLMLVKPADSEALADGILILKNNLKLREELAQNCFNKFLKSASPKVLGEELKKIIISIL